MAELKPCPFCGGEARPVLYHNFAGTYIRHYVRCQQCLATTDKYEKRDIAIEAWNRREEDENKI